MSTSHARRKDHDVDTNPSPSQQAPLPPPVDGPSVAPIMPAARSNTKPHLADGGLGPQVVGPAPRQRPRRSRAKIYTIGAIVFLLISAAGYIGFREYIYGDDAPPVPVLDD